MWFQTDARALHTRLQNGGKNHASEDAIVGLIRTGFVWSIVWSNVATKADTLNEKNPKWNPSDFRELRSVKNRPRCLGLKWPAFESMCRVENTHSCTRLHSNSARQICSSTRIQAQTAMINRKNPKNSLTSDVM